MSVGRINFDWGKSIFPLISCEFDSDNKPNNPQYCGTCFFAFIDRFPVVISARHVLEKFKNRNLSPCIVTRFGAQPALRLHAGIVEHKRFDMAFLILEPRFYEMHEAEFVRLPIRYESLGLGSDVFTLGFPNSMALLDDLTDRKYLEVDQRVYKGYVSNITDQTAVGGGYKTYVLSFPAMRGISGAPLLSADGGGVECIGFIFGQTSLRETVDQQQIQLPDRTVEIPIYEIHSFGVACDAEVLLNARELLENASAELGLK